MSLDYSVFIKNNPRAYQNPADIDNQKTSDKPGIGSTFIKSLETATKNPLLSYQLKALEPVAAALNKTFNYVDANLAAIPLRGAAFAGTYLSTKDRTLGERWKFASETTAKGKEIIKKEGMGGLLPEGTSPAWKTVFSMGGPSALIGTGAVSKGAKLLGAGEKTVQALKFSPLKLIQQAKFALSEVAKGEKVTGTIEKGLARIERADQLETGIVSKFFNKIGPKVQATWNKVAQAGTKLIGKENIATAAMGETTASRLPAKLKDEIVSNIVLREMRETGKTFSQDVVLAGINKFKAKFSHIPETIRDKAIANWHTLEKEVEKLGDYTLKNVDNLISENRGYIQMKAKNLMALGEDAGMALKQARESFIEERVAKFSQSNGTTESLFHGTSLENAEKINQGGFSLKNQGYSGKPIGASNKGEVISLSKKQSVAELHAIGSSKGGRGGTVLPVYIDKNAKIFSTSDIPKDWIGKHLTLTQLDTYARQMGFDGIDLAKLEEDGIIRGGRIGIKEDEVSIFNTKVLKTKSQLEINNSLRTIYEKGKEFGFIPVKRPVGGFAELGEIMPEATKFTYTAVKKPLGKAINFIHPVITDTGVYYQKIDRVTGKLTKFNPGAETKIMEAMKQATDKVNELVTGNRLALEKGKQAGVASYIWERVKEVPKTISDLPWRDLKKIEKDTGLKYFAKSVKEGNVQPFYRGGLRTLTEKTKAVDFAHTGQAIEVLSKMRRYGRWALNPIFHAAQVIENFFNKALFGSLGKNAKVLSQISGLPEEKVAQYSAKLVEMMRENPTTAQALVDFGDIGKTIEKGFYGGDLETINKISYARLPQEIERLAQGTKFEGMSGQEIMVKLFKAFPEVEESLKFGKEAGISEEFVNALGRKTDRELVQIFKDALNAADEFASKKVWGGARGGLEKSVNLLLFPTSYNRRIVTNMASGILKSPFYRTFIRSMDIAKNNYGDNPATFTQNFLEEHPEYFIFSNLITNYFSGNIGAGPQFIERMLLTILDVTDPRTDEPYRTSNPVGLLSPAIRQAMWVGDKAMKMFNK